MIPKFICSRCQKFIKQIKRGFFPLINRKIYEFSKQKISECQINPKVVLRYFDEMLKNWRIHIFYLVNYSFILIFLIADDLESIVLNKICAMNDLLNFCFKKKCGKFNL